MYTTTTTLKNCNILLSFPLAHLNDFRAELFQVPGIYGIYRINQDTGLMELSIGQAGNLYLRLGYHKNSKHWVRKQ